VYALESFDRWPSCFAAPRPGQGGQGDNPVTIAELPVALMQVTARGKQHEPLAAALADSLGLMTTSQSASLAARGETRRGSHPAEPKAPPTGGGEYPTARSVFFTLPGPGTSHGTADVSVIWLQPDSWLIQCAPLRAAVLHQCARAHPGLAAWVDQTHGRCLLRVTGASVRTVLARLCRLDLHERAFVPGACAATLVGHVDCLLRRVPEAESTLDPAFDLLVGSTWADWLLDELTNAADACGWRFLAHRQENEHG